MYSTLLANLRNSGWEMAVRKEVKKFLEKAGDDVNAKEAFDAVKDMARREIPQDAKKKLYDQVLEFVIAANNRK
uniref:Transcription and mRNA export factor ENY2 n=1 Tax=Caenorhabditis japonica TaxID=281687 RepID=A0A8R1HWM0_CAEJA